MKRLSSIVLILIAFFACKKDEVIRPNNIYNEWKWEATVSGSSQIPYQTSVESGTTFYYNFLKNGLLQIKDAEKRITSETEFEIAASTQTNGTIMIKGSNNMERHCTFFVKSDTLRLTNVEGIIAWTTIFSLEK